MLCRLLLCARAQKTPAPAPEAAQVISPVRSDGELPLRFHRDADGAWLWTDNPAFPLDGIG